MSTPLEFPPPDHYAQFPTESATPAVIDPDNPPWGVGAAAFAWLSSIGLMILTFFIAAIGYVLIQYRGSELQSIGKVLQGDPNVTLLSVASIIPAHLATLGVVWGIVTGFGKRPFGPTIGWSWSPRFGFFASAGLAILLLILGGVFLYYLGRDVKTPFDEMLESSPQARFATAFLATVTAPLVEELIYRGVMYPALRRGLGAVWAVLIVATLFTVVHVSQYYNNPAVIAAVGSLSLTLTLVRAWTGRVLPCVVIHLVFNGIQCLWLVVEYFYPLPSSGETPAGLVALIAARFAQAPFLL